MTTAAGVKVKRVLHSVGYTGWGMEELRAWKEAQGIVVVADVRISPFSRSAEWTRRTFEEALGKFEKDSQTGAMTGGYYWLKAMGNENYKYPSLGVKLADAAMGVRILDRMASYGPVAVLCMCPRHEECHRRQVVEACQAAWGEENVTVVEWVLRKKRGLEPVMVVVEADGVQEALGL